MKNILIIGANSALIEPSIYKFAEKKYNLFLVSRNYSKINRLCSNLANKFSIKVKYLIADMSDAESIKKIYESFFSNYKVIDILLISYGILNYKNFAYHSLKEKQIYYFVNSISKILVIESFLDKFKSQKFGTMAIISSVAGDIGKSSNYEYGSNNAMINNYLDGLRQKLFQYNIKIVNLKPGLISTPMTYHLKKNFLFSTPEKISNSIINSIEKTNRDIYLPFYWKYIVFIIKQLPKFIYNRINI